jgi:hypothetical protein
MGHGEKDGEAKMTANACSTGHLTRHPRQGITE